MSRQSVLIVALLAATLAAATIVLVYRSAQPMTVTLRLHATVGDAALSLGEARYDNPGGPGRFKVRDFQFFVSNVVLAGERARFVAPDSYHLARFDDADGIHEIVLHDVPRHQYERLELGVGVDAGANGSIRQVGDLDPNGRMAWSWDVGYKFVLFEGGLVIDNTHYPLVYHVGFDDNYKPVSMSLDPPIRGQDEVVIDLQVDLLAMFTSRQTVDMRKLSNVKFDRADARRLADNYASMLSLCTSACAAGHVASSHGTPTAD